MSALSHNNTNIIMNHEHTIPSTTTKPRRIIRRPKPDAAPRASLPPRPSSDRRLARAISAALPKGYEFEIPKTVDRIEKLGATSVALQMPEGLLMYATVVGDILRRFSRAGPSLSVSVLGDVAYGACCVDDLSARSLGADLLVHYGHSCLVPTTATAVPCLYVFVEIRVDVGHLVDCVRLTFEDGDRAEDDEIAEGRVVELAVMGTVQFRSAVVEAAGLLNRLGGEGDSTVEGTSGEPSRSKPRVRFRAAVPQAKPLSPGEVLGCTAPSGLAELDWTEAALSPGERRAARGALRAGAAPTAPGENERAMIFLADGRFHLEAAMISNPSLRAYRYDPYSKTLTEEKYDIRKMKGLRREAVAEVRRLLGLTSAVDGGGRVRVACARQLDGEDIADAVLRHPSHNPSDRQSKTQAPHARTMGVILGTLGRQGNPGILARIRSLLHQRGVRTVIVLLSEIFPKKLEMLSGAKGAAGGICAWVQIACPRLSIDWGHYFCVPVLSPFELFVALGEVADSTLWSASLDDDDGERRREGESDRGLDDAEGGYPMDFYSKAGGPWTNYHDSNAQRKIVSFGN